ncbi:MAG TPA: sigma-54 dependent transcriptional regulator [Blastocatellia bacterium]|nr:sigma-54 dependent transcriptional regulator [Blastocatellia bacterium]
MKQANVLLLDLQPPSEMSTALHGVLESAPLLNLQFQKAVIKNNELSGNTLSELVSQIKPAVIFLVSPLSVLQHVKSLFQSLRRQPLTPPVVIVSDSEAPDEMIEVIKLGAEDFITPPFKPIDILPRLWRLLEQTVRGETLRQRASNDSSELKHLIGESEAFLQAIGKIPLVAQCDATVLISGETGTGKEVCARAIHHLSPRANKSLVAINCGSIPTDLVESELFGHERGAFTTAIATKQGLIGEAEGGTLFLDELDSLPLLAQVKLLRFLQEGEFRPVGSTKMRHADVRVIAATNINIENAVQAGKIRQDLYYRLNMIPLALPPLRDRREDIPLLAATFLTRFAQKFRKHVTGFSPDTILKLCLHDWPGNVRELENVIGRAVAFAEDSVVRAHNIVLPAPIPESFYEMKKNMIEKFERTYIQSLLISFNGNITKAAEAAQKNRRAFFELIRKHGIDTDQFRPK